MTDAVPTSRDDYIHQYLEDKLRIPCVRIRLTQLAVDVPTVYEAPGTLELGKSFGVKGTFHAPKPGSSIEDLFKRLSMPDDYELGQLVREDQYFRHYGEVTPYMNQRLTGMLLEGEASAQMPMVSGAAHFLAFITAQGASPRSPAALVPPAHARQGGRPPVGRRSEHVAVGAD